MKCPFKDNRCSKRKNVARRAVSGKMKAYKAAQIIAKSLAKDAKEALS